MTRLARFIGMIAITAWVLCSATTASTVLSKRAYLTRPNPMATQAPTTFANLGAAAYSALNAYYYSPGQWNVCLPAMCGLDFHDWGADDMTYDVWLHWKLTHDNSVSSSLNALSNSIPAFNTTCGSGCTQWSDVPMWDSVTQSRVYNVTSNANALSKAASAFAFVDQSPSAFALGACPSINYQHPNGTNQLKTLETDANYIKAALLLYRYTANTAYLTKAEAKYAAVKQYFLDPQVPLYTVYVVDDGQSCTQIPHRFYASVNGLMIFNGVELAKQSGVASYYTDALATAQAFAADLNDGAGNYADLQAENDVAEPLIESMYALAAEHKQVFAQNWLLKNAANLTPASGTGAYGRFLNGPATPAAAATVWETNGGIALAMVAAALAPTGTTVPYWGSASYVADEISGAPATVTFTGHAIALIGTIGEQCCENGHARVFVDGVETFDGTGIWQNKSSAAKSLPNNVLFAWRFAQGGLHTISIQPGIFNLKEGGSYFHMYGYDYVP